MIRERIRMIDSAFPFLFFRGFFVGREAMKTIAFFCVFRTDRKESIFGIGDAIV